jgi:hypothetical protein
MRWETLFADLESRVAAGDTAELDAEIAERSRAEAGSVVLADRLRAHAGREVAFVLTGGRRVRGTVTGVGRDVVVLAEATARQVLVPLAAASVVSGLGRRSVAAPSAVIAPVGLRQVLRGLGRARVPLQVWTADLEVAGVVQRVAADHVDVSPRVPGSDLDGEVCPEVVALGAVIAVRSQ